MVSPGNKSLINSILRSLSYGISSTHITGIRSGLQTTVLLLVLFLGAIAWGQNTPPADGYNRLNPEGMKQIDRINEALHQAGKISMYVGLALLAIVGLRMLAPMRFLDGFRERRLSDAIEDMHGLLEHIRMDGETTSAEPEEQTEDAGILAGMAEVTGLDEGEDVPSYVLTVNDIMLDKIAMTLTRLRRMRIAKAGRYRNYMFTVLDGIKTITEQCEATGAASSLAINARDYFANDRRNHLWKTLLTAYAKRGEHREAAKIFLLFMKNLRSGKRLTITPSAPTYVDTVAEMPAEKNPEIPEILLEDSLPRIQQAAMEEAKNLIKLVKTEQPTTTPHTWQFELVQRQEQLRLRDEAKKILRLFLRDEIKALENIAKTKMLPCLTWDQILYMLGVEDTAQLHERVEHKLLTGQEIIILEKAFLQTFAKREALQQLYGHDTKAGVLMDIHVPQIQSETLSLLRQTHETEEQDLDLATERLDDKETPQRHEVARLIKHFVHHGHLPHNLESNGTTQSVRQDKPGNTR
jgi:hypothetical protein